MTSSYCNVLNYPTDDSGENVSLFFPQYIPSTATDAGFEVTIQTPAHPTKHKTDAVFPADAIAFMDNTCELT